MLIYKGSLLFRGGCRSLSGTSVASPVVAGAVTLLYRYGKAYELSPFYDVLIPLFYVKFLAHTIRTVVEY